MAERIRIRRDLAATWQLVNPILGEAEPGYESDTGKLKIGDGFNNWNDLVYFTSLSLNVAGGLAQLDGGGLVPRNLLPPATTSLPGALAASDKVKLDSLGSAAYAASTAFANAAQGALADTAIQPAALSTALSSKADLVGGKVPTAQIPAIAITEYLGDVNSQTEMLALTGQRGDWCLRTDGNNRGQWVLSGDDASQLGNWVQIITPVSPVQSVNGQTGAVTLGPGDVGAATAAQGAKADTAIQPGNAALTDAREWSAETISQNEAETGTATTRRAFTAQRVRQAIAAWWSTIASISLPAGSAPSKPDTGLTLFANASNAFSWIGANGFTRTFDGTANTANRTYTLPNASGTVALTSDIPAAGVPAGTSGQLQYNAAGSFAGATGSSVDASGNVTFGADVTLNDGGSFTTTLQTITPTANRTISLPDATGTVALMAGSSGQILYNNAGAVGGTTATWDATNGTRYILPFGYGAGAGGTVTQATNKSTGVTLNARCGQITMNAANLVTNAAVTFTLTNSAIAATDVLIMNHASGGTLGNYSFVARCAAGSATIAVRNVSAGDLAEAVAISFAVIKATTA